MSPEKLPVQGLYILSSSSSLNSLRIGFERFRFHIIMLFVFGSATVFGVSTESMQLSYDSRGNCVPVILLLLQSRLYDQGGLQAEGVFRITGENSEEEFVREQLNKGIIPDGIDVHCLAGLIKVLVVIVNHLTFVFENGRPEFDYVCVCGFRLGSESCREGYWILCHRSK